MASAVPDSAPAPPPGKLKRIFRKIWWLHSGVALSFGLGVMLFARAGLAHADKVLIALFVSWLLLFVALRFITGPANRREQEGFARKGIRVATNYIIKQFYQQMFFFLTPLYASSATWSFASWNWWLAPLLLICAVLSTMDLVFDHFVMERRWLASAMYGLAMFSLLNVLLPLVVECDHATGLIVAGAATPASVALLTFSVRSVLSPQGAILTLGMTGAPARRRVVRTRRDSAGTTRDAGDLGRQRRLRRARVHAVEQAPAPRRSARQAALRIAVARARWLERAGRPRVGRTTAPRSRGSLRASSRATATASCSAASSIRRSCRRIRSVRGRARPGRVGGQLVGLRKFEVVTKEGKTLEELHVGSGSASVVTPPRDAGVD